MPPLLEGKVKYKEGKKWKDRFCVLWLEEDRPSALELYIMKDPSEFRHSTYCPNGLAARDSVDNSLSSSASPSSLDAVNMNAKSADQRNLSLPRDCIYGCESGRHLDKERCVIALIGMQTVHCVALASLDDMFFWAKVLQSSLMDWHYHVSLVKCSMSSRLSAGTDGSLHVQHERLCFVAEPAQGNKFICAWRFEDLESSSVVDYQEKRCFQIHASKSAGKWRGQHIFSIDAESLQQLLLKLEKVKAASSPTPGSVGKESSLSKSRDIADSYRSTFAGTIKACIPWNQPALSPITSHSDSGQFVEQRSSPIHGSPSSSSTQTRLLSTHPLVSDSTTTLKTLPQKSSDVSPYHTDDIFSTDEDLKAEQHHQDVRCSQARHSSLDTAVFPRFGGESYTTTAASSGVSEDRRSLHYISGESYPTSHSGAQDRSTCPSSTDRPPLFQMGGQPLKIDNKPVSSQYASGYMCRSLELPSAWYSEASPSLKNRSIPMSHGDNSGSKAGGTHAVSGTVASNNYCSATQSSDARVLNTDRVMLRQPKTSASGQYPTLFGINEEKSHAPDSSRVVLRHVRHSYAGPSCHTNHEGQASLPPTKEPTPSSPYGSSDGSRVRTISDHVAEQQRPPTDNVPGTHLYINLQQAVKVTGAMFTNQAPSRHIPAGAHGATTQEPHSYINFTSPPREEDTVPCYWPVEMIYPHINYAPLDLSRSRTKTTSTMGILSNDEMNASASPSEESGKPSAAGTTDTKPNCPQVNYAFIIPQDGGVVSSENAQRPPPTPALQKQGSTDVGHYTTNNPNVSTNIHRLNNGALPPFPRNGPGPTPGPTNYASICGAKTRALSDLMQWPVLGGGVAGGPAAFTSAEDRLTRSRSILSSPSTSGTELTSISSDLSSNSFITNASSGKSSQRRSFLRFGRKKSEMSPPSGE